MRTRYLGPAGLAAVVALSLGGRVASAQYYGPDPFMPYARPYMPFVYPGYNTNPSLPNQARYAPPINYGARGGLVGGGPLDRYFDAMGGGAPSPTRGAGGFGLPSNAGRYDNAYRQYDEAFGRLYTPNQKADQDYLADRQKRDDLYARALSERDPQKKADLMRQLEEANRRAERDLLVSRRRVGGGSGRAAEARDRQDDELVSRRRVGGPPSRPRTAGPPAPVRSASEASRGATASPSEPASPSAPAVARPANDRGREPLPEDVLNRARRMGGRSIPPPPDPLRIPSSGRAGAGADPGRSLRSSPRR